MIAHPPDSWLARFRHLFYLVGAVGITWPLGLQIGSHLPLGTESVATVPLFNLWSLLWNSNRLQQGLANYWNAPIFFPETGTFALSEPQPLTGLIFSMLLWLIRNPIAAYNLALLLFLTLNAISADWLMRKLGAGVAPAFLTGLLALALPFVGNELGVLQLTPVFPIFFTFGAMWSFANRPSWTAALCIGGWSGVAFLLSGYYGLFLTLFLLLGGLIFVQKSHLHGKALLQLGSGVMLAGLILLPLLPEQARLTADYSRSETTIENNSAELEEYLHLYRRTLGEAWLPWIVEDNGRQRLYPGTSLMVLAFIGLIGGLRKRSKRRWVIFAALGAILAFLFSLGLNLSFGDWQPYRLIKDYYPGFAQLRSPFRLAVMVQIFLFGLAGFGLSIVWGKRWGRRLIAVVLVLLVLVEVVPQPGRLYAVPEQAFEAAWIGWLADQPGEGAVLMLPMSQDSGVAAFEPIVIGMLQGLEHGRPLGNGYSGFFPSSYRSLKGGMTHFPDEETIQHLQMTGFSYLIIDQAWWDEEKEQDLSAWEDVLELVYQDEAKVIYKIVKRQGAAPTIFTLP